MEELGYGINATTPSKRFPSIRDASYGAMRLRAGTSGTSCNSCELSLAFEGEDYERIVNVPMLTRLFHVMVTAFAPQIGKTFYGSFYDVVSTVPTHLRTELDVDWMMYFSRAWGTVPPLPAPVRIEPVGNVGTLVILSPSGVSASNPEDVQLGRQVQALLRKAGLLNKDRLKAPP